jgi:hypothetical protein
VRAWSAVGPALLETFQVWQGASEVTSGVTYAIQSNPSTLTASINSSTGVYSVTAAGSWANGSNTTSITFRATHTATGATRDAVLTLAKALAGGTGSAGAPGADAVVYEIEPSVSSVARNNIGVATPSSVTFAAYSKTGSAARVAFSGRFTIETFIDPTWTGQYTSVSNESSKTYTVPASVTAIRVKLYANGSLSPLLQQVTVPVVPDGIRSPMTLNSNSSATAVYGTVTSGAVNWTDAKGNEVVWRKLGYTSAPSATPADYLVRTDLVTLFDANPPTAGVKPATRYWTGSAWGGPRHRDRRQPAGQGHGDTGRDQVGQHHRNIECFVRAWRLLGAWHGCFWRVLPLDLVGAVRAGVRQHWRRLLHRQRDDGHE